MPGRSPTLTVRAPMAAQLVVAAGLVCLQPNPANGQTTPWWRDDAMRRELALTNTQVTTIEALFHATLERRRRLNKALDVAEAALEDAIARDDERAAMRLVARVEAVRTERNKARTLMLVRIYRVLTSKQRLALAAWEARHTPSRPLSRKVAK